MRTPLKEYKAVISHNRRFIVRIVMAKSATQAKKILRERYPHATCELETEDGIRTIEGRDRRAK